MKADHLWLAWVGDSRGVVGTLNTSTMRPMCSFATEDHDVRGGVDVAYIFVLDVLEVDDSAYVRVRVVYTPPQVDNEAEVERATNAGGATFGRYGAS